MAKLAPIVSYHTTSDTNVPTGMGVGEFAWAVGPTSTKLWVNDGTTNRLVLSNNRAESPIVKGWVTISDTEPAGVAGDLWFDEVSGHLFVYYQSVWVQV